MDKLLEHEALKALEAAVHEETANIDALRKSYTDHLKRVHESLQQLLRETEPEQADFDSWNAQTVQKLDALKAVLAELAGAESNAERIEALERDLAKSNTVLSEAQARVEALESELSQRASAAAAVAERQAELEADLAGALSRVEQEEKRAARLEHELREKEEAAGQAEHAREEIAAARAAVDALREEAEAATAASAELARERDGLRGDLEQERNRAQMLEQQLQEEKAKGTKSVLAEQLAEALKDAEGARDELRAVRMELENFRRRQREGDTGEAAGTEPAALPERPSPVEEELLEAAEPVPHEEPMAEIKVETGDVRSLLSAAGQDEDGQARTVGDLLVRAGLVSQEQLDEAVAAQRSDPHRNVGAILVEKGLVSEDALAQALAVHYKVPRVDLAAEPIDADAVSLVSQRLAQQHQCIPLWAEEDSIVVAIANPMNVVAIEDLERATNRQVEVRVATPTEIRAAIEQHFWEPE